MPRSKLKAGGPYEALSAAGGVIINRDTADVSQAVRDSAWRRHQMPAYHLMAEGKNGISLVNIGVGPSNAKTITDHLAVLRPEAWLMIGHCGGLRPSQTIGDYVLAHAYLRDDNVLNEVLPPEIPIPPIAEVQQALQEAAATVTGEKGDALKRRLRTGTVVTTDDRNWELRYTASALRFNQSRAVAIDMESATIAGQGLSFPRAIWNAPLRLRQAAPWRDQNAGAGEPFLRARGVGAHPHRHRGGRYSEARGRAASLAQAARVRRAAVPLIDFVRSFLKESCSALCRASMDPRDGARG